MSLILFLSCVPNELKEREALEWVQLAHNGDLLSVRWVESNTGLFKSQAHLSVQYFKASQMPVSYSYHAPEKEHVWNENQLQIGPHTLEKKEDKWYMNIRDDELNLRLQSEDFTQGDCQIDGSDWSASTLFVQGRDSGWLQSQKRSISLQGESILMRHSGTKDSTAPHRWLLVQSSELQIMYEDWGKFQGGCVWKDNKTRPLGSDDIQWSDTGATIATKDVSLRISWRKTLAKEDPYQHLSPLERLLAEKQFPLYPISWIQGYAQEERTGEFFSVIFRYQGDNPPSIKQRKTKPAFPNRAKSDSHPASPP